MRGFGGGGQKIFPPGAERWIIRLDTGKIYCLQSLLGIFAAGGDGDQQKCRL
jgi:hypothetical protein